MKITKSRLLQIIREEVELHEKKWEENLLEFDEENLADPSTKEPYPTDKNGSMSDKDKNQALQMATDGRLEEDEVDECGMEEDALYDVEPPHNVVPVPKSKRNKIEIKLR